jgi:hypothetical protein
VLLKINPTSTLKTWHNATNQESCDEPIAIITMWENNTKEQCEKTTQRMNTLKNHNHD